jgi:hypothetical protein
MAIKYAWRRRDRSERASNAQAERLAVVAVLAGANAPLVVSGSRRRR